MQYKVVPGPVSIVGDQCFGSTPKLGKAAEAYSTIINAETADGWTFVCFDTTTVSSACLGFFSRSETMIKLLVFSKP